MTGNTTVTLARGLPQNTELLREKPVPETLSAPRSRGASCGGQRLTARAVVTRYSAVCRAVTGQTSDRAMCRLPLI